MIKSAIQLLFNAVGLSIHSKSTIDRLLKSGAEGTHAAVGAAAPPPPLPPPPGEDYNAPIKHRRLVDGVADFGHSDFAELVWLFSSNLSNHRVIGQRFDEASCLWRAVKMSGGPILEIGRAAGGSTVVILGASGTRRVISVDRDPMHHSLVDHVFHRQDVQHRLTLHTQTSREPIPETEFGMLFIDGDHTYEGVCHDIAMYWNSLKPLDGKPAIAVFHDAVDNPVSFIAPVKRACDELIAEPGAARVLENWGSMLLLEKTGDIDQGSWFAKEEPGNWRQFDEGYRTARPYRSVHHRLHDKATPPRKGPVNLLGNVNLDDNSWNKPGVALEPFPGFGMDNPTRLVREAASPGQHGLEIGKQANASRFCFTTFIRPVHLDRVRLTVRSAEGASIAQLDYRFGDDGGFANQIAAAGVEIVDAELHYANGFFRCELSIATLEPVGTGLFGIWTLSDPARPNTQGIRNAASS